MRRRSLSATCLHQFQSALDETFATLLSLGVNVDGEVAASLLHPFFSVILWLMFVRRLLEIGIDIMHLVWIMRE